MTDDPPEVAAFTAVVRQYREQMVAWARRRVGNDAEEVTQEALMKAWKYWPPPHQQNIQGWFWTILQQQVYEWQRPIAWRRTVQLERVPMRSAPDIAPLILAHVSFERLPVGEREAVWLHDVMEYTHAEIHHMTGHVFKTTGARLRSARERLAQ